MQEPVEITGLWLRVFQGKIKVLLEIDGEWRRCLTESCDGIVSHIVEPIGIVASPVDDEVHGNDLR